MSVSDDSWDRKDEPVYVRFGPRDNQVIPVSWAEDILTRLAASNPAQFGKLLAKVALGE
jgi:hypothetical protein